MSHTQTARLVLAPGVAHDVTLTDEQELTVQNYLKELDKLDVVDAAVIAEAEKKSPLVNGHRATGTEALNGAGSQVEIQFERRARNG